MYRAELCKCKAVSVAAIFKQKPVKMLMMRVLVISFIALLFLILDWYVFQGVRTAFQHASPLVRKSVHTGYWAISGLTLLAFFAYHLSPPDLLGQRLRMFIMVGIFMNYFSKMFMILTLFIDDLVRGVQWTLLKIKGPMPAPEAASPTLPDAVEATQGNPISRSEFLAQAGIVMATVPFLGMSYGILSGAHDYRIRRVKVVLPNLPKAFDGLKIAQLSDIHSGSFFHKKAVEGGVDMLLAEKPDVVLFTGDLVNNVASEMRSYQDVFSRVKAPMGVYSVLGNHDYGDYVAWSSNEAKARNLADLKATHGRMGWNLLMNEHRMLEQGGEKIAIIGIENWGAKARFPKYGQLELAHAGTEEAAVKLLLSHDPSHWDAQVRSEFPDIDIQFAGHTHGMQFGVEIGGFKWSPVQYVYEQWAGLYQQANQYLYVNRGFGYLGFPGRIGILPEITIMELKRG